MAVINSDDAVRLKGTVTAASEPTPKPAKPKRDPFASGQAYPVGGPPGGYKGDLPRFEAMGEIPPMAVALAVTAVAGSHGKHRFPSHLRNSYCPCGATNSAGRRLKGRDCCYQD